MNINNMNTGRGQRSTNSSSDFYPDPRATISDDEAIYPSREQSGGGIGMHLAHSVPTGGHTIMDGRPEQENRNIYHGGILRDRSYEDLYVKNAYAPGAETVRPSDELREVADQNREMRDEQQRQQMFPPPRTVEGDEMMRADEHRIEMPPEATTTEAAATPTAAAGEAAQPPRGPASDTASSADTGGHRWKRSRWKRRTSFSKAEFEASSKGARLSFEDIHYSIKVGKRFQKKKDVEILKGVSGVINPGELFAILGPSGCGKTTLLNVISGRVGKKGVTGSILLNGKPITKNNRRQLAYVMQDDCLLANLTVRETLMYAAQLRLPSSISKKEKEERVEDMIRSLGLVNCANTKIGGAKRRGVSGGERKRVAVGVELITEPAILFLDEPTSGLDAFTAYNLVQTLSEVAREKNKCIVMTIHQPRSQVFDLFDKFLLMSSGNVIYQGPAHYAVQYFEEHGYKCPNLTNPADYFLDLVTPNTKQRQQQQQGMQEGDDHEQHQQHQQQQQQFQLRDAQGASTTVAAAGTTTEGAAALTHRPSAGAGAAVAGGCQHKRIGNGLLGGAKINLSNEEIAKLVQDFKESDLMKEIQEELARDKQQNGNGNGNGAAAETESIASGAAEQDAKQRSWLHRLLRPWQWLRRDDDRVHRYVVSIPRQIAILTKRNAVVTIRDPEATIFQLMQQVLMALIVGSVYFGLGNDQFAINDRAGALFFISAHLAFSSLGILNTFPPERRLVNRERASNTYSVVAYFTAKTIVEIPMLIIAPIVFSSIVYWMLQLQAEAIKFFIFIFTAILANACSQSFGFALSSLMPNITVANIMATIILVLYMLFGGFYIRNIPPYYLEFKYISYVRYTFTALARNEFEGLEFICTPEDLSRNNGACPITSGTQALEQFQVDVPLWACFTALALYTVFYRFIGLLGLSFLYKKVL